MRVSRESVSAAPGTTFKAVKVHNLPAFLFFYSVEAVLKSVEVRASVSQSGGIRGHIWGHKPKKWGHIKYAPYFLPLGFLWP